GRPQLAQFLRETELRSHSGRQVEEHHVRNVFRMLQFERTPAGPFREVLDESGLLENRAECGIAYRIAAGHCSGKRRAGQSHFLGGREGRGVHQGRGGGGLFSVHAHKLSAPLEAQNRAPVPAPSTTVLLALRTSSVYAFASFPGSARLAAERLDQG